MNLPLVFVTKVSSLPLPRRVFLSVQQQYSFEPDNLVSMVKQALQEKEGIQASARSFLFRRCSIEPVKHMLGLIVVFLITAAVSIALYSARRLSEGCNQLTDVSGLTLCTWLASLRCY